MKHDFEPEERVVITSGLYEGIVGEVMGEDPYNDHMKFDEDYFPIYVLRNCRFYHVSPKQIRRVDPRLNRYE